ncbi:SDR family oxidoreductase [Chryseobacterium sp. G0186]|uniref:SDR family NAD(P)-dependent oxidoreductase n=1 Tax=Chryseobacterium sp. G0186 TaxID=2487064 RepID=UPI000F5126AD|nr:SDR family oxidoreductase [Chryseobacterium sp. G0186]AZA76062.1 SDR family oxidoreductase [Chryseobacterium sp. G0186]
MDNKILKRFTGKTTLVTGAGSGIGKATTLRILKEGGDVIGIDISEKGLQNTLQLAENIGLAEPLTLITADVSKEESVKEIGKIIKKSGKLDVLINAAGILMAEHTHTMKIEHWNHILAVNLTGTFLVIRETLPTLLENKGVIVNFSSTATTFAHPYMAAYAATKGAIQSFTHAIALEYSKKGLRAVAVAPGGIKTSLSDNLSFPSDADLSLLAKLSPAIGQGPASPDYVAGVIAMLASEDGSFITGTEIRIDGGAHM